MDNYYNDNIINKKRKIGVKISHWKVGASDVFGAIAPERIDEELDIGSTNAECDDALQENMVLKCKN